MPHDLPHNPAMGFDEVRQTDAPRFRLIPFSEISFTTASRYLVKGMIPRDGLVIVWGPPKCGKSFWVYDCMMHVALGWPYRDRRVTQGPVVYIACEGENGLGARTEAFRQRRLSEEPDIPFHLLLTRLNLVADAKELIGDIRRQMGDTNPIAVVVDTLNRSMPGSESSDEDMSAYVKAADMIREAFACAVVIIHHCGIDDKRPRGHTSLTGAADAQLAVKRDIGGTITTTVEWLKDGAEGDQVHSRLDVVELGDDQDGEAITSCVIEPAKVSQLGTPSKLSKNQQTMLSILTEAGAGGLTVEEWNDKARVEGIGVNRRADLRDNRVALKAKSLVYEFNDRWYAQART